MQAVIRSSTKQEPSLCTVNFLLSSLPLFTLTAELPASL